MTIVTFPDGLLAYDPRGKYGFGRGYGGSQYGHARYGLSDNNAGIYQRKVYGANSTLRSTKKGGRYAISRQRFYRPTNTRQPAQQAWRGQFAGAISAYHALTDEERAMLSIQAKKRGTSGYHLFISQWLQSHRA